MVSCMRTMLITLVLLATAAIARADERSELAHQRQLQIQRLRAYADAGVFPADAAERPLSVFRDARGRLCPMAHLIAASGHRDLVDHVARTNNRLRLADVRDGALWTWMQHSGLTRDEIIRIQGVMSFNQPLVLEPPPNEHGPTIEARRRTEARRRITARLRAIVRDLERTPAPATVAAFRR